MNKTKSNLKMCRKKKSEAQHMVTRDKIVQLTKLGPWEAGSIDSNIVQKMLIPYCIMKILKVPMSNTELGNLS